jgi:hypothetical protein
VDECKPLTSGWNTDYRAQLEDAMASVAESKDIMKNLRTMRAGRGTRGTAATTRPPPPCVLTLYGSCAFVSETTGSFLAWYLEGGLGLRCGGGSR